MPESLNEPPKGFRIATDESDDVIISYNTTGMGCLLWFLVILLVGVSGAFGVVGYYEPGGMRQLLNDRGGWFSLGCGIVAAIFFVSFLLFHLFGSTLFCLNSSGLTIRKCLFGLTWGKAIDRDNMEYLEQVKDGGEGEDSFPSWGLNLMAGRRSKLLARQPIEKSDWLGRKLSEFFKIEFKRCLNRE